MGIVFRILTAVCGASSLFLVALSITSGLYMLAELAEEFPSTSGKAIRILIYVIIGVHVALFLDGVTVTPCGVGILSHLVYLTMLSNFPFIEVWSLSSFASALVLLVDHYYWFKFFVTQSTDSMYHMDLFQVFGFFVFVVWSVPCGLLISLTINENVLPGIIRPAGSSSAPYQPLNDGFGLNSNNRKKKKNSSIFRNIYDLTSNGAIAVSSFAYRMMDTKSSESRGTKKGF